MTEPWADRSMELWTGRVIWAYIALLIIVWMAPPVPRDIPSFLAFVGVYWILLRWALDRSDPVARFLGWWRP